MNNPLLESKELLAHIEQAIPDYYEIKKLVYKIFRTETGLDATENAKEFHKWLNDNDELNKRPAPNGGYYADSHPLFHKRSQTTKFTMFKDLHDKIGIISQQHCQYCHRGYISKLFCKYAINISPISQNKGSIHKNKKVKAFKNAINNYFSKRESEFKDGCKLCITVLFILGKDESDKDCDNMSKALNDGLNDSLIKDDVHIDHLNIMKIKTNFNISYIIINIRESNLNKHYDVLIEKSHYEPNLRTGGRINLNDLIMLEAQS